MRYLSALLVWFFGFTAFANPDSAAIKAALELYPSCSNLVRFDDANVYLGFGPYRLGLEEPRLPIPGQMQVISLENPRSSFVLSTRDSAIDAVREGNSLFVLTYSGLEEWDLTTRSLKEKYPTYAIGRSLAYKEHAQAFARFGDKLVIAHGRLGVSIFDLRTKRVTNQFRLISQQRPLESMATGIAISGRTAYLALDNFSIVPKGEKPAFRGIVTIDLATEKIVSELEGLDPGADAVVADDKSLIVSYMGMPIWKYSLSNLRGRKLPAPEVRVWKFPAKGHPTGRPAMDEKNYYTCFSKPPENPSEGGLFKRAPLALDRRIYRLD